MIKQVLNKLFGHRRAEPSPEIHALKNIGRRASAKASVAAGEYIETIKQIRRNDVIYQIGAFTGNVKRD